MNEKSHYTVKLNGVGCGAVNCRYHGPDYYCHAESINISNPSACCKTETFCATFTPKGE